MIDEDMFRRESTRILMIDDTRDMPQGVIARDFASGIHMLMHGGWDLLYLDHDLGCFDEDGNEKTGYDILCWLEKYPYFLPRQIKLVTSNAAVRVKMQDLIEKIYKENT